MLKSEIREWRIGRLLHSYKCLLNRELNYLQSLKDYACKWAPLSTEDLGRMEAKRIKTKVTIGYARRKVHKFKNKFKYLKALNAK
jgi:hypothetical protein